MYPFDMPVHVDLSASGCLTVTRSRPCQNPGHFPPPPLPPPFRTRSNTLMRVVVRTVFFAIDRSCVMLVLDQANHPICKTLKWQPKCRSVIAVAAGLAISAAERALREEAKQKRRGLCGGNLRYIELTCVRGVLLIRVVGAPEKAVKQLRGRFRRNRPARFEAGSAATGEQRPNNFGQDGGVAVLHDLDDFPEVWTDLPRPATSPHEFTPRTSSPTTSETFRDGRRD